MMNNVRLAPLAIRRMRLPATFARACSDLLGGLLAVPLWGTLGWQDIRQRYRRSVLGPFWLTISTAAMVAGLGVMYAGLFHQPLEQYLPFIAVGMIVWTSISSILNESCTVFIMAEGIIKQIRLPLTAHVCRMVWRNLIIFAHNAIIILVVYLLYGKGLNLDLLSIPLALVIYAVNGVWAGILLGIFCARFRDIAQIVANIVQLLFFVTPIMWRPGALPDRGWIAQFNPFHHFIELLRAPVLGEALPLASWLVALGISAAGIMLCLVALARFRHRVPYWL